MPGATPAVGKRGKQRGGLGLLLLAQVTDAVALLRDTGLLADRVAPDGGQ
ncbi:hypothetical protein [Streptomyces mirabilis]